MTPRFRGGSLTELPRIISCSLGVVCGSSCRFRSQALPPYIPPTAPNRQNIHRSGSQAAANKSFLTWEV
jgi:hypothetical protein